MEEWFFKEAELMATIRFDKGLIVFSPSITEGEQEKMIAKFEEYLKGVKLNLSVTLDGTWLC